MHRVFLTAWIINLAATRTLPNLEASGSRTNEVTFSQTCRFYPSAAEIVTHQQLFGLLIVPHFDRKRSSGARGRQKAGPTICETHPKFSWRVNCHMRHRSSF